MAELWSDAGLQIRRLLRRCVVCPDGPQNLSCPACKDNEVCTQKSQTCEDCVSLICLPISQSGSTNPQSGSGSSKSSIGAIVGGVVGGVIVLTIISYFIWKYFFKKKMKEEDEIEDQNEKDNTFTLQRKGRASTYTVASLASTVLTRASNVIQIAFIPGYNTRRQSEVPDVPPLPGGGDAYYRAGGHPRGSAFSEFDDPRESIKTLDYGGSAVATPVVTAVRGRAAVVSVRPNGASSTPNTLASPRPAQSSNLGKFVTNANGEEYPSLLPSPASTDKIYEAAGTIPIAELPGSYPVSPAGNASLVTASLHAPSSHGSRSASPLPHIAPSPTPGLHELPTTFNSNPTESQPRTPSRKHSISSDQKRQGNASPFSDENRIVD